MNDDLHFVVKTFGEQGAQRTVDQTRRQRFFFGRLAFALEKSTGDLACSVGFFDVVNGQGEKILS